MSLPPAFSESKLLGELQSIYAEHRYLDVWNAASSLWHPAADIDRLSIDELLFAARLSTRLGGPRLGRKLFRRAKTLAPSDPKVRYFTEHLHVPGQLLLDELAAFEAGPDLGGDDFEARANWLAHHAVIWARLRNLPRAHELMRQAHAILPDDCWLYAREADIWGIGDDWDTSLGFAEQASSLDPRSPWAAISLASALMNTGQMEQAVERITAIAADTQSSDLLQAACWYQCAWTESLEGQDRIDSLARARALAERIEPLAPLADREFKADLARIWLDIATLGDSHDALEHWAREARSPFHRQLLANLKQNPIGRRIRLPYRRVLQKHHECVPASVSSALSASNIDVSTIDLAAEVTYGGTAEWAAADWLRNKHLHVRFFSATAETAWRLIEAGIGFMVTWPDDDGGHAVAIVGMDEAAGLVLAHDPSSLRTTEYLVRAFDPAASPYGVLGMAAVRMDRAAELDNLLPPEAAVVDAAQAQQKALMLYGPVAAAACLEGVSAQFLNHPAIREMLALQDLDEGRTGQALASFRLLLGEFPRDPRLRLKLITALRALGNTALLRETLRTVFETGSAPGVQAETAWIRPHPRYVTEYADMLRASPATRHEAELLLRSVLRSNWSSAAAWHVLADLRWDQRRVGQALLAYSIASFLAPHNEHYARAYVDVLHQEGRGEEGLQWLENRVARLGRSLQGVHAWTTWIDVLEDRGYPEQALAAYARAAEMHRASIALQVFAVPFLARMGRWDEARAQLEALAQTEGRAAYHEAAVAFHRMRGEPLLALEHAEAWTKEMPAAMGPRYALLSLVQTLEGNAPAAARGQQWMREHPANEDFEQVFCQYAQDHNRWRKLRVLRMRLKRNAEDGWAWRELVFAALAIYEQADSRRRRRTEPRIEAWLGEAARVSGHQAAFVRAKALWQENRGYWREAVDGYLEAIRLEPQHFYSYRRAWDCAARLAEAERRELWAAMESHYLDIAGHLPNAVELSGLLAGRFGVPETEVIVARWRERRPDDPNVLEAAADLLLNHGHGKSANERALEIVELAVQRFPDHSGLRFSLARTFRAVGKNLQAHAVFHELVERKPDTGSALISLAWIEHRQGNTAQALETLKRAGRQAPHDPQPIDEKAKILIDAGRDDEALALVEQVFQSIPDSVQTYEAAIARFRQCGRHAEAVEAARRGTRVFPRGAYLWLLLARTLRDEPEFAAPGELEASLRRSIKLNATLYESTDWLSVLLCEQHRYDEATALLRAVEPYMADPSPARGRLAWIKRQRGEMGAAINELAEVVALAPWYGWGWQRLLGWLGEDKDWTRAKSLLSAVPPLMLDNLEFRQKRLELLEKAGADKSVTESEWEMLLVESPEDVVLHLRRFDVLQKAGRLEEGGKVLRRLLPQALDNVYLRARLVHVDCQEKNHKLAVQDALLVCFAKIEESEWPADEVWKAIRKAGILDEFADGFQARLEQGDEPTPRALSLYAEYLLDVNSGGQLPKWLRDTWINAATRRVQRFVRLVERSSWVQPAHMAKLMAALNKSGHRRLVLACWSHLQARGLDSDTAAWAQAGNALINMGRKHQARNLLADWRTRKGVQMWMLGNYVLALPRLTQGSRTKVTAVCQEGLATLGHDHCARYLAYMGAEACVLNRDKQGLLAIWQNRSVYFEKSVQKGEFFPEWQRYLVYEVPRAVRLLSQPGEPGYASLRLKLHAKRLWSPPTRARARRIFWLLLRLLLIGMVSGSAMMQLFR